MYKIVPKKHLKALFDALNGNGAPAAKLMAVHAAMAGVAKEMMDIHQCRFQVEGTDNAPAEFILPEILAKDFTLARKVMDSAIIEANRETAQGSDGQYYECLSKLLAKSGIQAVPQPANLGNSRPWDSDCTDVLGDMLTNGVGTEVVITNAADVFEHGDADVLEARMAESGNDVTIDPGHVNKIRVVRIGVSYPRAERYGVPESATDSGAREYVRGLGFLVPGDVDVCANDTGDDSSMTFEITGVIKDELICREVPQQESLSGGPAES